MLITVTIIGMLAAITMGGLSYARQAAREAATKATIAKLHNILMEKYESYVIRRVPVSTAGLSPKQAAEVRLAAIRDLMRMEMPERWNDVTDDPAPLPYNVPAMQRPALSFAFFQQYQAAFNAYGANTVGQHSHAKCLYMIVAANPENLEQFNRSEIGVPDGDGLPVFLDGWGNPIYFLRWAPAFSYSYSGFYPPNTPPANIQPGYNGSSDIQSGSAQTDHDPFDTRKVDPSGFKLIPLIYSTAGRGDPQDPQKHGGINMGQGQDPSNPGVHYYNKNKVNGNANYANTYWQIISSPQSDYPQNGGPLDVNNNLITSGTGYLQNIHNHHIESR